MNTTRLLFVAPLVVVAACAASTHPATSPAPTTATTESPNDRALDRVAAIHGGAGPWVVAGYRMGDYALAKLGLDRGSFDLEVTHYTPHEVQYSCIADGAAAATGASLGRLNLSLVDAPAADVHTTYRRKSTGQAITLRISKAFAARYTNVPRPALAKAGREVIALRDEEIFEVVP